MPVESNRGKMALHIHFFSTQFLLYFTSVLVLDRPFPWPLSLPFSPSCWLPVPIQILSCESSLLILPFSTLHTVDHLLLPQAFAPRT